jgi:hypothetical protein
MDVEHPVEILEVVAVRQSLPWRPTRTMATIDPEDPVDRTAGPRTPAVSSRATDPQNPVDRPHLDPAIATY